MCILHIVFCTVCKYVLSICKLLLLFCTVCPYVNCLLFFCTVCPYVNCCCFFCTVCPYVNCLLFFCTVWSTLIRISLTKALVLWWCDNKSDLIWFEVVSRQSDVELHNKSSPNLIFHVFCLWFWMAFKRKIPVSTEQFQFRLIAHYPRMTLKQFQDNLMLY